MTEVRTALWRTARSGKLGSPVLNGGGLGMHMEQRVLLVPAKTASAFPPRFLGFDQGGNRARSGQTIGLLHQTTMPICSMTGRAAMLRDFRGRCGRSSADSPANSPFLKPRRLVSGAAAKTCAWHAFVANVLRRFGQDCSRNRPRRCAMSRVSADTPPGSERGAPKGHGASAFGVSFRGTAAGWYAQATLGLT